MTQIDRVIMMHMVTAVRRHSIDGKWRSVVGYNWVEMDRTEKCRQAHLKLGYSFSSRPFQTNMI